ncbi:hypothetical protein B4135_3116 [Caldibacillus debilis]|uniref:Uncharacterized protein n=1 Tax=Caldibacillus debilis TaxID=301148 RepID=A0A150LKE8_9BACI|nr:hypothetical protein B4135_3116 [Caldibacillus debilis]
MINQRNGFRNGEGTGGLPSGGAACEPERKESTNLSFFRSEKMKNDKKDIRKGSEDILDPKIPAFPDVIDNKGRSG